MACTQGNSPDTLLYVPAPFGSLNEPVSANCYRNDAAVVALAVVFILLLAGEGILVGLFLTQLKNARMQSALSAVALNCIVCIAYSFCAIFSPEACFFLWSVASFLVYVWWMNMVSILQEGVAGTVAKIDKEASHKITAGFNHLTFQIICFVPFMAIVIGGLGASISRVNGDEAMTLNFWRLHCVGWIVVVNIGLMFWSSVCRKAADVIEGVASKVQGKTDNNRLDATVKNFRKTSLYAFVLWPAGVGLWLLHLLVLPCFFYLSFMHVLNIAMSGLVTIFFFTTDTQRKTVFAIILCKARPTGTGEQSDRIVVSTNGGTEPTSSAMTSRRVEAEA